MKTCMSARLMFVLLLVVLPSCGTAREVEQELSCFGPSGEPGSRILGKRIDVSMEHGSVVEAIERLNVDLGLPISFVEGERTGSIQSLNARNTPVRDVLQKMLSTSNDYGCTMVGGRIVVIGRIDGLHEVVRHVDITGVPRARASRMYLEKVSREVPALAGLDFAYGGILDSPVFSDPVSLAEDATVLEHLVQLLGKDESVYFWIRRTSTGHRYLTLGSVPTPPGNDMRRAQ